MNLQVYYKNGTKSSRLEPLVAYKNAIDAFKAKHPDFYGAKLIISPLRFMNNDDMTKYIDNFKNLKVNSEHYIYIICVALYTIK